MSEHNEQGRGGRGGDERMSEPHTDWCDDRGCYCPDDAFWGRLLGDDDPAAPGKDWAAAAFTTTKEAQA